ncbi:MAG: sigma-70 family RNA polymerase sigma factor [Acidobacteriota bacterium]|nr:sigma-70 family RNA polymerase sigma factor [Acidobacteriota bacterium]
MNNDWVEEKKRAERDWLIEKHKPLVLHLAKKISNSLPFPLEFEDLVAYGQLGLIEASERFDSTRGNSFGTFAFYRIRGAIYDGLREMGAISRSRSFRFAANANDLVMTEADDAIHEKGASSVDDEVKSIEKLVDNLIPIYFLSLDAEGAMEVKDESAFKHTDFEQRDLLAAVRRVLEELEPEESELLSKIYFKSLSMTDLAAQMGVTKSWVSRLHARAIKHLQAALKKRGILDSG